MKANVLREYLKTLPADADVRIRLTFKKRSSEHDIRAVLAREFHPDTKLNSKVSKVVIEV